MENLPKFRDTDSSFEYLADIARNLALLQTEETTRRIKEQLIGSTITSIEMEKLPRRKTMYNLTINTTAKPIEIPKVVNSEFYIPKGFIDCSEIKVRVKMRR